MSQFFSAMSRIIACFPEKFPSVPIPGEISRFPEQYWLCPETVFVRVVTPCKNPGICFDASQEQLYTQITLE